MSGTDSVTATNPDQGQTPSNQCWSDELTELYAERFDQFVALAKRIVGDRFLAEEVVQDAFLSYQRKQPSHAPDRMAAYLRSMVRNGAISTLRREIRRRELRDQAGSMAARALPSIEDDVVESLTLEELIRRLSGLPLRQSQVVECRLAGLSVAETADALMISSGSVKTHRHRAAAALRQATELLAVA